MKTSSFFVVAIGLLFAFSGVAYAAFSGVLVPLSDGTFQSWSPVGSVGGTHAEVLDEGNCNGTTDFVRTTTVNARDSYFVDLSGIPNGTKITKIHVRPCASMDIAAGVADLDVFAIFNGVQGPDKGNYPLVGFIPTVLATTTFQNVNMFKTPTSTLEIGVVYDSGNAGARVSKIYTVLEY